MAYFILKLNQFILYASIWNNCSCSSTQERTAFVFPSHNYTTQKVHLCFIFVLKMEYAQMCCRCVFIILKSFLNDSQCK